MLGISAIDAIGGMLDKCYQASKPIKISGLFHVSQEIGSSAVVLLSQLGAGEDIADRRPDAVQQLVARKGAIRPQCVPQHMIKTPIEIHPTPTETVKIVRTGDRSPVGAVLPAIVQPAYTDHRRGLLK